MAYVSVTDIETRISRTLSEDETKLVEQLLYEAAIIIDAYAPNADDDAKAAVTIRMVSRVIGSEDTGYPVGAMQGSMSGLGYSQSWTMGTGGATGELYLSRTEKQLLCRGNQIGSRSPLEDGYERIDCNNL